MLDTGSSPRLRGTFFQGLDAHLMRRFIPAPAGNMDRQHTSRGSRSVHPRACGEHDMPLTADQQQRGSSPRLRGTFVPAHAAAQGDRFIPAPAGNISPPRRRAAWAAVHPRACGEHLTIRREALYASGSSPRLRGTYGDGLHEQSIHRFIPAPAGNIWHPMTLKTPGTVHPRACGEHLEDGGCAFNNPGSSPRLRGTFFQRGNRLVLRRFIPAPAGNIISSRVSAAITSVHPRACGEHSRGGNGLYFWSGSSPRLRGTCACARVPLEPERFIPAPAGNIGQMSIKMMAIAVHPRACGEHRS